MRNAATFDDDIGFEEPARKAPRKPRASAKRKKKSRRFGVDLTKVARYAAIGAGAALSLGIMVNALMMQKGQHPAPLFAKAVPLPPSAPAPLPVARTMAKTSGGETPDASATPRAAPAPASIPVPPAKAHRILPKDAASAAAGDDAIGRLLKASAGASAAPAEKPDPKTVFGVQQALVKLGFVLKPNGTFGPATRKAIEMFEKDRHLPVKGEMSHRLVKILAAESGVKID